MDRRKLDRGKQAGGRKDARIRVRMAPGDIDTIDAAADAVGVTRSAYVRQAALGAAAGGVLRLAVPLIDLWYAVADHPGVAWAPGSSLLLDQADGYELRARDGRVWLVGQMVDGGGWYGYPLADVLERWAKDRSLPE